MPPLLDGRSDAGAIGISNRIFLIGGKPLEHIGDTILYFDIATNAWMRGDVKLPIRLCNPGLCTINATDICILGGDNFGLVMTMHVYTNS